MKSDISGITTTAPPLIDMTELRMLTGRETFTKGTQLMEKGRVSNLCIRGSLVTADVRGSYTYQVMIALKPELQCSCTCPAADYMDVCKHAVAVALLLENPDSLPTEESDEQLLRRYFGQKKTDELIELLLQALRGNESLMKAWLLDARLTSESISLAQLKKMVTKALPSSEIWDWHEVYGYFSDAEPQLDSIWNAMEKLPVVEQWALTEHVLKRLNNVLQRIDDSGGHRFTIEGQILEKMPVIFEKLDWPAAKKAQWLFEHLGQTEYDVFPTVDEHFVLSAEVQDCLLKLCSDAVEAMAAELKMADQPFDVVYRMRSYARPLLTAAQQNGDWRKEGRLLSLLAHCCRDYLDLSKFYLEHQEELDAEDWLLKAKKVATPHDQIACWHQEVRVKIALGENKQAWNAAWRSFEHRPSYREFQYLLAVHEELGQPEPELLNKVEQILCSSPRLGNELLEFYTEQKQLEKAKVCVKAGNGSRTQILQLADLLIVSEPDEALVLYRQAVKGLIEETHTSSYEQAIKLLLRLQARLKANRHPLNDFGHSVAQLATEYRRKRNMLALFNKHFAAYL
ncbi:MULTISPECIES: SWIM zinc finger family protein [unclassified Serratia (in: enterobacteria)]|uniref:SWIM zinc finger family protein n=1 Tax=unclassified Serratia (in: enterobacteria) TaxID=2647522 RepID=UPI00307666B0